VQYLATAEIIPIALIKAWHELKARGLETFITNTIHDSIIAEVHPDEVDEYKQIMTEAFTTYVYYYLERVYDIKFFIPLGIGIKIGDNWGEAEEEKIESEPPYTLEEVEYGNNQRRDQEQESGRYRD